MVSASDGANTATRTITVNLTDLNDSAPVITTAAIQSVAENSTVVAALTSTDADTVGTNPATFTIAGGADAALFDVVAGNLVFRAAPNFETDPHSYQVVVSASDGANTATQTITVNLTDLNDNAPVITTAAIQSVAENSTVVAALTSTDADTVGTNPATFTITGGADAALFDVVAGNLVFRAAPNFETDPHSYQVVVSASDGANTATRTITVNLTDLNDNAPVITTAAIQSVAENSTVVAALTSTDADTVGTNPATFTIAGGADAALFDVVAGNLVFRAAPNFENPTDADANNIYDVTVRASDGVTTDTQAIAVTITNVSGSFVGTSSNDTIVGTSEEDSIDGLGGNDTITGGAGADVLTGGLGADIFVIGAVADLAAGETINGTAEAGTIDTLRLNAAGTYNLSSFTTITNIDAIAFNVNAAGFNLTVADSQVSTADANGDGTQNDLQISASVAMTNGVTISAAGLTGTNHITVVGTNLGGADTITGGAGADTIDGGAGIDTINGGAGADVITGGAGADVLTGGLGPTSSSSARSPTSPPARPSTARRRPARSTRCG